MPHNTRVPLVVQAGHGLFWSQGFPSSACKGDRESPRMGVGRMGGRGYSITTVGPSLKIKPYKEPGGLTGADASWHHRLLLETANVLLKKDSN